MTILQPVFFNVNKWKLHLRNCLETDILWCKKYAQNFVQNDKKAVKVRKIGDLRRLSRKKVTT